MLISPELLSKMSEKDKAHISQAFGSYYSIYGDDKKTMNEHQIITNPPPNWLERLRRDHKIWLVKEQETASVEFPYEPSEPGRLCGRIGIRRHNNIQSWFISTNGEGINGSLLMQPLQDNLPDNPEPLPESIVRQIQRTLEQLDTRLYKLESKIALKDLIGYDNNLEARVVSLETKNDEDKRCISALDSPFRSPWYWINPLNWFKYNE